MSAISIPRTLFGSILAASLPASSRQTLLATLVAPPVVGKPTRYTLPAGSAAVMSQQWYSNGGTGSGPVAIPGATSATYVQTSTSEGFMSVRGVLADGSTFASPEFTTTHSVVSKSAILTPVPSRVVGDYLPPTAQNAMSLAQPTMLRWYVNGYYQDRLMAPGDYSAYDSNYAHNELAGYGPSYSVSAFVVDGSGTAAVLAQQPAPPATASRPPASTGTGFFTSNGQLYDANGNQFRMRGADENHWNAYAPGIGPSKVNVVRIYVDFTQPWATNQSLLDGLIAKNVVPMIMNNAAIVSFTGSITGLTLTVSSVQSGRMMKGTKISLTSTSGTIIATVSATAPIPTGGGAGSYTLASSSGDAASRTFFGYVSTTGSSDPDVLDGTIQTLIENRANLSRYDTNAMFHLCNEWGPSGGLTAAYKKIATGGSGYATGTYTNVALTGGSGSGMKASITVNSSGVVSACTITTQGTGYRAGDVLSADASSIGGTGSGFTYQYGNTVWRDAYIASVTRMRAAGFKNTLVIDAPGSGQDSSSDGPGSTMVRTNPDDGKSFAQNIFEADPQRNVVCTIHIYGAFIPGAWAALAAKMNAISTVTGQVFAVTEFGPPNMLYVGGSPTMTTPLEVVSVAEAFNIGYLAWAIGDPSNATTDTGTYALIKKSGAYNSPGGYATGNPAELTDFGRTYFLDPVYGTQVLAQPASIF